MHDASARQAANVPTHELVVDHVQLGYDGEAIIADLSVRVPPGRITSIVGANACGKSTLLRGMARLLAPRAGAVLLDGKEIHRLPTKQVATTVGLLPQTPIAPDSITVADLVGRGRFPHQSWFRRWSVDDEHAVTEAMRATGVLDLAARDVDHLSGGQRQRVWIAMALAQGTALLLLDEPTTYLDVTHQIELLDLLVDLNARGRTIVLVMHDLNLAVRYSHHLIALRAGELVAEGDPATVVDEAFVDEVFGLQCRVIEDPVSGTPLVLPIGRHCHHGVHPLHAPVG